MSFHDSHPELSEGSPRRRVSQRARGSALVVSALFVLLALYSSQGSGFNLTPAPASAGEFPTGDVNCSQTVDAIDVLTLLRYGAGLEYSQQPGCTPLGSQVGLIVFGDIDCDLDIDAIDALFILRFTAGLAELPECVLQGLLPGAIDGVSLQLFGAGGDDLLASDPAWTGVFDSLGIAPESINVALAYPPQNSPLVFQMTVAQTSGAPWGPRFGGYLAHLEKVSAGAIDIVNTTIEGRLVRRLTDTADPAAPAYYFAEGDLIFVIQSPDPDTVAEIIAGLPDIKRGNTPAIVPAGAPPSGLALHVVARPPAPPCVASQQADSRILMLAFDSATIVPAAGVTLSAVATLGQATSAGTNHIAPAQNVLYEATRWSAKPEQLLVSAATPWGDAGDATASFNVRHCLSGDWRDGPRVLRIQQNFSGDVTAPIVEGTLDCGETGVAFSGKLEGNTIAGDNLLVCTPNLCYNLGLLERTGLDEFTATVRDDGYTIDVEWHRRYYMPVADQNDDYVECVPAQTISETFELRRLSSRN